MDKLLPIIFFFILLKGQENQWYWQNPLPQGNNLTNIQAVTSQTVFAAGEHGTFLRTINSGAEWQSMEVPRKINVSDMHFIDENHGWVIGTLNDSVFCCQTGDAGESWSEILTANGSQGSVYFLDEATGWITMDSTLYHTQDFGNNWDNYNFPVKISKIYFRDALRGWACGNDVIFRTIDGGGNWDSTVIGEGLGEINIQDIAFVNEFTGWVIAMLWAPNELEGLLYKTDDGGITWYFQYSVGEAFIDYRTFEDIEFVNENMGFVTSFGQVYATYDGGEHWEMTADRQSLDFITIADDSVMWGAGQWGHLYKSSDSGLSWENQSDNLINNINDINFVNAALGFVAGDNKLLKTVDGGSNWQAIDVTISDYFPQIISVSFISDLVGWIIYGSSGWYGGVYKTFDGGNTWNQQLENVGQPKDMFFIDDLTGWVMTYTQGIFHTTDGGESWELQMDNAYGYLNDMFFSTPDSGWVGGQTGLYTTSNGGETWLPVEIGDYGASITHIYFKDALHGWITGYGGSGYYYCKMTDDGGINWSTLDLPETVLYLIPEDVYFNDDGEGWIVGRDNNIKGFIIYSPDNGDNWEYLDFPTGNRLSNIEFANGRGWITGDGGSILSNMMTSSVRGDVNSDGSLDILDILLIRDFIFAINEPSEYQFWASDLYESGTIDILDIVALVNLILQS